MYFSIRGVKKEIVNCHFPGHLPNENGLEYNAETGYGVMLSSDFVYLLRQHTPQSVSKSNQVEFLAKAVGSVQC
jgi:hypothetical protein